MSDIILKQRMRDLSVLPELDAVTGVTIWYADELAFRAGEDSGRVVEVDCPWATQQMADDLLEALASAHYRPFEATDALVDPAAELGDSVEGAGLFGYLSQLDVSANPLGAATASAPGEADLDHEYPYLSPQERAIKRAVKLGAQYYGTTISRQYGIRVETVDAEGNVVATATLNSDGIAFTTPGGSGISLGADGKFHGDLEMDGSIKWDDLSPGVQASMGDDNPPYIKSTYIDEAKIVSPEIYGGYFYATGQGADDGAAFYIYDGADVNGGNVTLGNLVGYLSYDNNGAGTPNEAAERVFLTTLNGAALKLQSAAGMSLEAEGGIYVPSLLHLAGEIKLEEASYGDAEPAELGSGQLFFVWEDSINGYKAVIG